MIAEFNALQTSNLTLQTSYVWGLDLSGSLQGAGGVGGLLAQTNASGSTYYPAYDGNGNVMGYYASETGQSLVEFEYGPFGELIRATGSKKDDFHFRFSTKYEDAETGLLYYGFRYYDAETGRWLSRDPIGEAGRLNLYGMVGNNPVNFADLLGLATIVFSAECDRLFQHLDIVDNIIGKNFEKYSDNTEFLEGVSAMLERMSKSNVSLANTVVSGVNSAGQLSRAVNQFINDKKVKNFLRNELSPQEYIKISRASRGVMGELNSFGRKLFGLLAEVASAAEWTTESGRCRKIDEFLTGMTYGDSLSRLVAAKSWWTTEMPGYTFPFSNKFGAKCFDLEPITHAEKELILESIGCGGN